MEMVNLPADLPENLEFGQVIAPNGSDVGKPVQYGYNYLLQQVNETQRTVNTFSQDVNSSLSYKANIEKNILTEYLVRTQAEFDNHMNNFSKTFADRTNYNFSLFCKYESPITGGVHQITGFKTTNEYEYQCATRYDNSGVHTMCRSKNLDVWGPWQKNVTTERGTFSPVLTYKEKNAAADIIDPTYTAVSIDGRWWRNGNMYHVTIYFNRLKITDIGSGVSPCIKGMPALLGGVSINVTYSKFFAPFISQAGSDGYTAFSRDNGIGFDRSKWVVASVDTYAIVDAWGEAG